MKTLEVIFILVYAALALAFIWRIFISKNKKNAKKTIYFGFHVIYFALAIGFFWSFKRIVEIQYFSEKDYVAIGDKLKPKPTKDFPKRGTIYSLDRDGNKVILSEDLPVYNIFFNGAHIHDIEKAIEEGEIMINKKKFRVGDDMNDFFNAADSIKVLAGQLAKQFGSRAVGYNELMRAYNEKNPKAKLLDTVRDFNIIDLKKINDFTLFNGRGKYSSCLVKVEKANRVFPYKDLAKRTIGNVDKERIDGFYKGNYGIEAQFDSIMRGVAGEKQDLKISINKTVIKILKPKKKGADIILTLDMEMQEIVTECLRQQAQKLGAERACAILMEVESGEIKAMANLIKGQSSYYEKVNMAISDMNPPGSTFKTLSMLVALENGFTADTIVNSFDKMYPKVTDHAPNVSWRAIPLSDVLVYSSNVGISNIIGSKFKNSPMNFVKEIHKTKINEEFDIMLPGAARFKIGEKKSKNDTIDRIDGEGLASLTYGYQVVVPPLYMLRFYNAIANGGKMINPFLVKDVISNEKSVKELNINGKIVDFPANAKVVNSAICSSQTLKDLQKMLYDVVQKKGGTGYNYRSEKIKFAGKTGTAFFKENGVETDQVSFCGYFPADSEGKVKPKYTCIVIMQRKGLWGSQSCEVFRNIAEKIFTMENTREFAQLDNSENKINIDNKKIAQLSKKIGVRK